MVYHSVVLDVQKNTSNCVLDIYEKDKNSHQLLIKLICDADHPYNISGYRPEIEFFDTESNTKVLTTAVDVINPYRGYLSYILGERILQDPARYTVSLRLYDDTSVSRFTCTFILNVIKDPNSGCDCPCCGGSTEVTISKEFYDALKKHIENSSIHVSESDRVLLDYFTDNFDELVKVSQEFPIISQNVQNLNEITTNLTTNLTTLSENVTNLTGTVSSLSHLILGFDERIKEVESQVQVAADQAAQAMKVASGYDKRITDAETASSEALRIVTELQGVVVTEDKLNWTQLS